METIDIHQVAPKLTVNLPPIGERNTVAVFRRHLRERPDKVAVRDPGAALSYAQLHERALRMAGALGARGIARGDGVLLMLDNHVDYVIAWLANALTGRVEIPVNTAYKGAILAHLLENSGAKIAIVEAHYLPVLQQVIVRGAVAPAASGGAGTGAAVPGATAAAAGVALPARITVESWEALDAAPEPPAELNPWDLAGILYTSGTTGPSKGVRVTHAHAYGYSTPEVTGAVDEGDVTLCTLPMFHIGGQWALVYNALIAGATAVILPRFAATSFWDDVRRYGCTYTMLLGAMANFLWRQPPAPGDADQPMKRVIMVPVIAQVDEFARRFGIQKVSTGFGSTECSFVLGAPPGQARANQCGWPRPDIEIRLVDEHDMDVKPGEVGELVLRAREPWVLMDGYHRMPEATVAAWRNQWLHTGDALRQAPDGQYVFVDRIKDAVRRRGENVSSFEVEKEINEHPAVLESAVIGVRSPDTEDEIMACVVLRPGMTVDARALWTFLDERLPYFMVPRYLDFMDALPKTPTEKIRKQALRDRGLAETTIDRDVVAPRAKGAR